MLPEQRESARREANTDRSEDDSLLKSQLITIKHNWRGAWYSEKWDPDFFGSYLVDQRAAQNTWDHIKEDIFIVVDEHSQVVFANVENLA